MRGQAYTLEGVLAAIVVVTATVYGLSAVDTGPFQTGAQQRTAALETRASDTLSLAAETGALHNATACYSVGTPTLNGNQTGSSTEFEMMLNHTFDRQATSTISTSATGTRIRAHDGLLSSHRKQSRTLLTSQPMRPSRPKR